MKTIISITPTGVEKDSRTFKQAASVARFGYNSIVVEAEASHLHRECLPFELRSLHIQEKTATLPNEGQQKSHENALKTVIANPLRRVFQILLSERMALPLYVDSLLRYYILPTLRKASKACLYYLHDFRQFPAVYLLCRRYRAPYIYDAHDFYSRMDKTEKLDSIKKFLIRIEALCIRNAAAVVTVSEGIAGMHFQTFGRRPAVLRNCHDPRLDREPPVGLRNALGLRKDDFLLVLVGHAKPGQALVETLEAMTHLPSKVHVALLGKGYEAYRKRVQDLGLRNRVHIVLPVKPFEVVPFIRSADAALIVYYPQSVNYFYCLPNRFFQPIAAELPIIYPELPEINKIAKQYELGIPIDPKSPGSISRAVLELIRNPERLSMYRQNARRAGQELSWEQEEGILRDLLCKAIGSV